MAAYIGSVSTDATERALVKLGRVSARSTDLVTLWRDASDVISTAVPHYAHPCWYTLDPASLLITSHFDEGVPEFPREWLAHEYYEDGVHKLVDIARSKTGISTLHDATHGDPSQSWRWQANMEYGADQEMIARLQTKSGEVWGALGLYRAPGEPMFSPAELRFLTDASQHLALGARRALLMAEAGEPDGPDAPGLLVLTHRWEVESATPGVEHWLDELPDGDWDAGKLPSAVLAVAGRALKTAEFPDSPGEVAISRVLSRGGTWVVLHGVALVSNRTPRVAVIIEPAHPARITPLLMSAYGLTEREQDVTRLVLQGASTGEIADDLVVSPHTVQQHLKSVFDKTGVRSRRDLVGKVFFTHYEPRFRDNERRTATDRPIRGGPAMRLAT